MNNLIKTDLYLLLIDPHPDTKIVEGDSIIFLKTNWIGYCRKIRGDRLFGSQSLTINYANIDVDKGDCKKILAYLPIGEAKPLEGLPLLPPLESEEDINVLEKYKKSFPQQAELGQTDEQLLISYGFEIFKGGYKANQSDKKYSEEDMVWAMEHGYLQSSIDFLENENKQEKDWGTVETAKTKFIQSLATTKYPVSFEVEMISDLINEGTNDYDIYPKVVNGVLQGIYKY